MVQLVLGPGERSTAENCPHVNFGFTGQEMWAGGDPGITVCL